MIEDLELTAPNKRVVSDFLEGCMQSREWESAAEFLSDRLIQHNPEIGDGRDGWISHWFELEQRGEPLRYETPFKLIGQGNFAAAYSKVHKGRSQFAVFDLFRLENGRIVEHWDNWEPIPSPEDTVNSGKF